MMPDELLLRAAFYRGERGVNAWREWAGRRDLETLGAAEMRLLPAVYSNLRETGTAESDIAPVVKKMTRSMYIRTRLLMSHATRVVRQLQAAGIGVQLLKGAAVIAGGTSSACARPMSDFDLLVRKEDAIRAASVLTHDGWVPDAPVDGNAISARHAALFKRGEFSCDLHWWALWESRDASAEARWWSRSREVTYDGVTFLVPAPTDQLLHVIVHGTRSFDTGTVRWIGDAIGLLDVAGQSLDWGVLIHEASARGLAHPVAAALRYLRTSFDARAPEEVLSALGSSHPAGLESWLYVTPPARPRANKSILFLLALLRVAMHTPHRVRWLLLNLSYTLGVRSFRELPRALVKKSFAITRRQS